MVWDSDSSKLRTHNNKRKTRTLLHLPWCYTHYNTHIATKTLSIQRTPSNLTYLTQNETLRARVSTPNRPSSDHDFHKPNPCNTNKQRSLQWARVPQTHPRYSIQHVKDKKNSRNVYLVKVARCHGLDKLPDTNRYGHKEEEA